MAAMLLAAIACGGSAHEEPPSAWVIVETANTGEPDRTTLLRSDDLGTSWSVELEYAPVEEKPLMADVSFADRDHGWVVGGPNIWRTNDGGRSWDVVEIAPDHEGTEVILYAVQVFDARHVAVAGEELQPEFPPQIYFHWLFTVDGGDHWKESSGVVDSVVDPADNDNDVIKCVANGLSGYLAGLVTGDGGATWTAVTPLQLPAFADETACTPDLQLWAIGLSTNIELDVTFPILEWTPDQGRNWVDRTSTVADFFVPAPGSQYDALGTRTLPGDIAFFGTDRGWILLTERSDASLTHHLLLRTTDAGSSWSRLPDPPYPIPSSPNFYNLSEGFSRLSFASSTTGALSGAACITDTGDSCVEPSLAITTDGGQSFAGIDLRPYVDGAIFRVHRVAFAR